ncbi:MAG: hypothetical protein ABWX95_01765, partial [Methyloceanibacter sp.]
LSLALLPVAGVAAPAASTDTISTHADCCSPDGDCGKHSKGNCTDDAACALKCAGVSALPLTSAETASIGNASAELTPIPRLGLPVAPNPPSPPPRT